jgi:Putative peptidoglycan binding domain
MNSSNAREPFSLSEFAAGSIAVAAVALIAFQGVTISQPPDFASADLPAANPLPATQADSSPSVSQPRRHVPTAAARARQSPPPNEVMPPSEVTMRASESRGPALAASDPPIPNPSGTKGASVSNFLVEAAPATIVEMQSPEIGDAPPPLIGPVDLFRTKNAISTQPPKPIKEAAIPATPEAERNPSNRIDAVWIQTRLHDLGYFAGNANGVWGPTSRSALRDFKTMNGLAENDKWDPETEQRLLSVQNVSASSTFIGGWAQSVEECQRFRGGGAPLIIRPRAAETDRVKCSFRSVKREVPAMWRVQAACSAEGQSWNANVSLKLTGSNLKWSSERGTETYVRCVKP